MGILFPSHDQEGWSLKTVTGPTDPSIKHCQEYQGKHLYDIQQAVFQALDKSDPWLRYTVYPKQTTSIIVNRYKEGHFYREHTDKNYNCKLGAFHYSNTLFVNDPKSYEGGELILTKDEEEHAYKLNPGDLLTYQTGVPHRVEDVTQGVRYSIVFWTESWIRALADRDTLRLMCKVRECASELSQGLPPHKGKQSLALEIAIARVEEAIISEYHVERNG